MKNFIKYLSIFALTFLGGIIVFGTTLYIFNDFTIYELNVIFSIEILFFIITFSAFELIKEKKLINKKKEEQLELLKKQRREKRYNETKWLIQYKNEFATNES